MDLRDNAVIVQQEHEGGKYDILITADVEHPLAPGYERHYVTALARAKTICDETGLEGVYFKADDGGQWEIESYLRHNPRTHANVRDRMSRAPSRSFGGLVRRIKSLIS